VRVVRWVVAGLVLGALAAFVAELVRPRRGIVGSSGYRPPVPSTDHRVVLPSS
jgi:hypothetical protein